MQLKSFFKKTDLAAMDDTALVRRARRMKHAYIAGTALGVVVFIPGMICLMNGLAIGFLFFAASLSTIAAGCVCERKNELAALEIGRRPGCLAAVAAQEAGQAALKKNAAETFNTEAAVTLGQSITGMKPLKIARKPETKSPA